MRPEDVVFLQRDARKQEGRSWAHMQVSWTAGGSGYAAVSGLRGSLSPTDVAGELKVSRTGWYLVLVRYDAGQDKLNVVLSYDATARVVPCRDLSLFFAPAGSTLHFEPVDPNITTVATVFLERVSNG